MCGASGHLTLLPVGIVVEPSLRDWLLIALEITSVGFSAIHHIIRHTFLYEGTKFNSTSVRSNIFNMTRYIISGTKPAVCFHTVWIISSPQFEGWIFDCLSLTAYSFRMISEPPLRDWLLIALGFTLGVSSN